jgi:succinate dehydrogenase / fumarate reductase cytochrome b subunit
MGVTNIAILRFYQTSIGQKVIMAVGGLIWIGYLIAHMYGNLKIFGGQEHFNEYATGLRTLGAPIFGYAHLLWVARVILIVSFFSHVWAGLALSWRNRTSRGTRYTQHKKLRANSATLSMLYGGVAILLFVIYHLLHITFGTPGIHPDFAAHDAYHNVVVGFQSQGYVPVIIYLVGLVAVGFHLYHGTWSTFQTLGLNNKTYTQWLRALAVLLAIGIPVGFATVPFAIVMGIVS